MDHLCSTKIIATVATSQTGATSAVADHREAASMSENAQYRKADISPRLMAIRRNDFIAPDLTAAIAQSAIHLFGIEDPLVDKLPAILLSVPAAVVA